ncbi:leucyl-tRNA synthetase [Ekhidna lutea]|uniref:Leucine--tRNA ligase n=1 Tax=Ekhidna lutea TaxID=447679 RepID=A0A239GL44_EKHLU|nr:class I tRNA ligase family protein [Ekhidna lutea]SNS68784.1 leucyl-tRNA synthetase [Ekhidna lutea]
MAEYNFQDIEKKWQKYWKDEKVYEVSNLSDKPKYYIMDMFPYPSGAGLHVGHPLGYIASDIVARYKRLNGFNVLHPMGFDSFGLPAEQYAIQTGQHPAITTEENITRYKEQLKALGFSYDWSREVRTSDPSFYKWTQWIFKLIYNSWYNNETDKAEHIDTLIAQLEKNGNASINAACDADTPIISADDWNSYSEKEKQLFLLKYRLTYQAETTVNWCPALGTVLSNDEVKDGFSERGGHPVVKKKMPQWSMRITAYADRLLSGLDKIDWPEPIKEMQRNWIGKSYGAEIDFPVADSDSKIRVFTTRIDTIFGVSFMVVAPESELVAELTTQEQKADVDAYVTAAKNRSERERMSDAKNVTGSFTGSYAIHPFTNEKIPVYVADYVLAGYGTGAVMAVPSGDQRDFDFAKKFNLPIPIINDAQKLTETEADPTKEGKIINSDFLDGLSPEEAMEKGIEEVEKRGIGVRKVNYKLRDAIFGRQRYWGEPIPVYYEDGIPKLVPDEELPLNLPKINEYLPTEDGDPPLGRADDWNYKGHPYELSTMPGWAGSSWYFFRYMDPDNEKEFCSKEAMNYWKEVDFYLGGSEHATGHLLYSRFWVKFLNDMGIIEVDEYAKKLVNQGMIQGRSNFVYRLNVSLTSEESKKISEFVKPIFISAGYHQKAEKGILTEKEHLKIQRVIDKVIKDSQEGVSYSYDYTFKSIPLHVDVNIVKDDILDIEAFKQSRPDTSDAEFILEDGKYHCGWEVEKMSKSKFNVVNPDDLVEKYGADTLRMYEMFLGPIEQSKPWNTNGIEGVYKFLRKFWSLFHNADQFAVSEDAPTKDELKVLHSTIKKVSEDAERLSLNTSVSTFMIAVNELSAQKCNKRAILEPLTIILSPFAPHIAEELWHLLGYETSVVDAAYPVFEEKYLVEDSIEYPVSVNGKMRAKISFPADASKEDVEAGALANETIQKWMDGKDPRKVIVVPKKIVNIVV